MNNLLMFLLVIFLLLLISFVVKYCKKGLLKISLLVGIIIITLYCVILSVDIIRISTLKKPIFAYEIQMNNALPPNEIRDVTERLYQGVGYRVEIKYLDDGNIKKMEMYMFNKIIASSII